MIIKLTTILKTVVKETGVRLEKLGSNIWIVVLEREFYGPSPWILYYVGDFNY